MTNFRMFILFIVLMTILTPYVGNASQGWNFVQDDVIRWRGQYYDLTSYEDKLYLACKRGVEIYSISDPDNPEYLGQFFTDGLANGVAIHFPYLYVGDVYGFSVWDVTDPMDAVRMGGFRRVSAEGYQERLTYRDGFVYAAAYSNGLQIIDVSDPSHPFIVSEANTPAYSWDLALIDSTAYMMDFFSLEIIDISRPLAPLNRTSFSAMFAGGIALRDNLAFIAFIDGMMILDISNRYAPTVIAYPGTTGSGAGESIALVDQYAILAHQGYVELYDVSAPNDPYQVAFFTVPGHPRKLHVAGDHLYTILDDSGFHVTDLSDPEIPLPGRHIDTSTWGSRQDVAVYGDHLYLCDWNRGLVIYDISQPDSIMEIATYLTPGMLNEIFFDGTRAYLSCYTEMQILDISNPSNPVYLGSYRTTGNPWGLWASGSRAYLCDLYSFHVLDVSDPGNIQRSGAVILSSTGTPYRTVLRDNLAYVAHGYGGLKMIDVSDPSNPEIRASWPDENTKSYSVLELSGNRLFALNPSRGIDILNISDPLLPVEIGQVKIEDVQISDFAIKESTIFASAANQGVYALDISNEESPKLTGWIDTPGTAVGIAAEADRVFVADDFDLAILRFLGNIPDPTAPEISIEQPLEGMHYPEKTLLIQGTSSDNESGIDRVELSFDGGSTWIPGRGQETWSYLLSGRPAGLVTVLARATNRAGMSAQSTPLDLYFHPASPMVLLGGFATTRATHEDMSNITLSALILDPYDPAYVKAVQALRSSASSEMTLDQLAEISGYLFYSNTSAWEAGNATQVLSDIRAIDIFENSSRRWPYLVVRP